MQNGCMERVSHLLRGMRAEGVQRVSLYYTVHNRHDLDISLSCNVLRGCGFGLHHIASWIADLADQVSR